MKVFRVEEDRDYVENFPPLGPYQAFGIMDCSPSPRHPMPHTDGISDWPDEYIFGFKSAADLIRWFKDYEETLDRHGLAVSEYIVPKQSVLIGGTQLCFDYDHAKFIRQRNILDFFLTPEG